MAAALTEPRAEARPAALLRDAGIVVFLLGYVGLCLLAPIGVDQLGGWNSSYAHGFLRRGLAGEVVRRLTGEIGVQAMFGLARAAMLVPGLAVMLVAAALVRRGTAWHTLAGLLLALSPMVLTPLAIPTFADQFGYVPLILVLLACHRTPRTRVVLLGIAGGLTGVLVLVHEGILLIHLPWLLLAVAGWTRGEPLRRRLGLALLTAAAPAVAGLAVLGFGRANAEQLAYLQSIALDDRGRTDLATYATDTLTDSVHRVAGLLPSLLPGIVVGLAYAGLQLGLVRWCLGRIRVHLDPLVVVALAGVVAGFVLVMATGTDWVRWFERQGLCALLLLAGWALYRGAPMPDWSRSQFLLRAAVVVLVGVVVPVMPLDAAPVSYYLSRLTAFVDLLGRARS